MGDIKGSLEAAVEYLTAHPDEARYTDSPATAVLEGGLRVRVTGSEGHTVTTDMPPSVGGGGEGPSAGWLLRAALASCEATLIAMRAAQAGIELSHLEVTVDSESDDRGILGMAPDVPAGPLSVRVSVTIQPSTPEALTILEGATSHCPVHDAIARAVPIVVQTS
jgi:uncharacterized OsmC-like protein